MIVVLSENVVEGISIKYFTYLHVSTSNNDYINSKYTYVTINIVKNRN